MEGPLTTANCNGAAGSVFLTLINALFATQCMQNPKDLYKDYANDLQDFEEFDFIIVGSGAAGSVLANRLTEDKNVRVALIEAGGFPTADSEVPAFFTNIQFTDIDWQFVTVPSETGCQGFKNGECTWPSGKLLGGSSSINFDVYTRGSDKDYDDWGRLGNAGWNYSEALKYFKKAESVQSSTYSTDLHGTDGPIKTSRSDAPNKMKEIFLEAAREAGFPINYDEKPIGFVDTLNTIVDGRTATVAKSYLGPIQARDNLKIVLNAYVTKVIIEDNEAKGVEVDIGWSQYTLKARKEVIVSAGAIKSPQLLMLSGIGHRDHLEEMGIETIADLPVGDNLQDHISGIGVNIQMNSTATENLDDKAWLEVFYKYCTENGAGPLGSLGAFSLMWFFSTKDEEYPDIELFHFPIARGDESALYYYYNDFGVNEVTMTQLKKINEDYELINIGPSIFYTKSRGTVRLQTGYPYAKPLIDAAYFNDPEDMKVMVDSMKYIRKYLDTDALKQHGAKLIHLEIPGCEGFDFDSDDYWACNFRNLGGTIYDYGGTNKMGADGVVDERLKVHGIKALRVVDASVMPVIPRANMHAPTVMVAEKAADMIKEDYGIPL